jgi:membrane-associated HD superfamily phosphohydrolase
MILSKITILFVILIISYTLYSYIKSYNEIVDELKKIREKCVIDANQEDKTNIKEEKESFSKSENKKGNKNKKKKEKGEEKTESEEINDEEINEEKTNNQKKNTEKNTEKTNNQETNIESFENFSNEKYINYWKPYKEDINKTSEGFQDSPYKGYNKYLYE